MAVSTHFDKENRPVSAGGHGAAGVKSGTHGTRRRSRSSISGPSAKAAALGACKPIDCHRPFQRTRQVQLPKSLPRPTINKVDLSAIAEVEPDLAGVPTQYVLDKLDALRARFIIGAASVAPAAAVQKTNWESIQVRVNDSTAEEAILPTHMFAVTGSTRDKATLYPCHQLLFAAQCSTLPSMPPAASFSDDDESLLTLPIVPIYLPSPETFSIVREFIYTRAFDRLLSSLLPIPASELPPIPTSAPNSSILSALSIALVNSYSLPGLLERAKAIHGVWSNTCALGISDAELWKSLETAWTVLIEAIALSTGQSSKI